MAEPQNKRARLDLEGFTFSSGNNNVITFLYPRPQTEEERYGYNIGCKYFKLLSVNPPVLPPGCRLYIDYQDRDYVMDDWKVYPVTNLDMHRELMKGPRIPTDVGRAPAIFQDTFIPVLVAFGYWLCNIKDKLDEYGNPEFTFNAMTRHVGDFYIMTPFPDIPLKISKPYSYYTRVNNIRWLGLKTNYPGLPFT